MEWISVKDRLPNQDDSVLCYSNGYCDVVIYHDGLWDADRNGYRENVTHWMPLPPKPIEITNK